MGDNVIKDAIKEVGLVLLGIDVGGTYTDGALIGEGRIIRTVKRPTEDNLLSVLTAVLDELLSGMDPGALERITFSTTLVTNLIAQGHLPKAAILLLPGPGVNPSSFSFPWPVHVAAGAIDYRGREIVALEPEEVLKHLGQIAAAGVQRVAVAGKFAVRNWAHELKVRDLAAQHYPELKLFLSHELCGQLNLPRRAATTALTAVTQEAYQGFWEQVEAALEKRGIAAPAYVVKADGGALPLAQAKRHPVETIFSGPASSALGALALGQAASGSDRLPGMEGPPLTAVVIDIGGTTTDLALILNGQPLLASKGAALAWPGAPPGANQLFTHVRALAVRSLPRGGDSQVRREGEGLSLRIGPERLGPAACLGGPAPTLTDALRYLGEASIGDRDRAKAALGRLMPDSGTTPADGDAGEAAGLGRLAQAVVEQFVFDLASAVEAMFQAWCEEPAYRVWEIMQGRTARPDLIIGIGAAAAAIAPRLAQKLGCRYWLPPYYQSANAVGAALARPTLYLTWRADTEQSRYQVAETGQQGELEELGISSGTRLTPEQAEAVVRRLLIQEANQQGLFAAAAARESSPGDQGGLTGRNSSDSLGAAGRGGAGAPTDPEGQGAPSTEGSGLPTAPAATGDWQPEIVYSQSFNLVRGWRTVGRILEIRAQLPPGLVVPLLPLPESGSPAGEVGTESDLSVARGLGPTAQAGGAAPAPGAGGEAIGSGSAATGASGQSVDAPGVAPALGGPAPDIASASLVRPELGLVFFPAFDWAIEPTHPEREERLLYTKDQIFEEGLMDFPAIREYKAQPCSPKDVARAHFCVPAVENQVTEAHLIAAGSAILLARAYMEGQVTRSFALVRPPGHHARRIAHGNRGFCNINNEAIMIEYLRRHYGVKRVAIVDTDVHHGDGTQDIYYDDPDVLFISIHQDGRTLYPGSGFPGERGGPNAGGFTINIPLLPGSTDATLHYVLDELILPILEEFQPQIIVNSAGQDNHYTDPLANMSFSAQGYARLTEKLKPDLAVLEGGYAIETALPYVNLGLILALAGMDYSWVKEPDYPAGGFKESEEIRSYTKGLVARVREIWQQRGQVYDGSYRLGDGYWSTRRSVFYDTDGIRELQEERIKDCPREDCLGYSFIASRAVGPGIGSRNILAISIPWRACPSCASEARELYRHMAGPQRPREAYQHVYLQDKPEDTYRHYDLAKDQETVL